MLTGDAIRSRYRKKISLHGGTYVQDNPKLRSIWTLEELQEAMDIYQDLTEGIRDRGKRLLKILSKSPLIWPLTKPEGEPFWVFVFRYLRQYEYRRIREIENRDNQRAAREAVEAANTARRMDEAGIYS